MHLTCDSCGTSVTQETMLNVDAPQLGIYLEVCGLRCAVDLLVKEVAIRANVIPASAAASNWVSAHVAEENVQKTVEQIMQESSLEESDDKLGHGPSQRTRIVRLLHADSSRVWSLTGIVQALKIARESVSAHLCKMIRDKSAVRVRRSMYRAYVS